MNTARWIGIGLLVMALAPQPAWAQAASAPAATVRAQGDDRVAAGEALRIDGPVAGDLIAAGGQLDIDGPVAGDVLLAGGDLRLRGTVAHNAYLVGGRVRVESALGRNLRVAGGQVELGPGASVAGNVSAAGGQLELRGPVQGSVLVAGGRVRIDAPVQGDVDVTAGRVELGSRARIAGRLRVRSSAELQRDAGAEVAGGVDVTLLPGRSASAPEGRRHDRGDAARRARVPGAATAVWALGLALLAVVLTALLPSTLTERLARQWRERFGWNLLWGFVALVCIPVAALSLLVTLVGAPLALVGLLLYAALLPVGYAVSAVALGLWGLARWRPEAAGRAAWRLLAVALAVVVLAVLGALPWLGWLVGFAAVLAGVGVALQAGRSLARAGD